MFSKTSALLTLTLTALTATSLPAQDIQNPDPMIVSRAKGKAQNDYMIPIFIEQAELCEAALETGTPLPDDFVPVWKFPDDMTVDPDPEILLVDNRFAAEDLAVISREKRNTARNRFETCFDQYIEVYAFMPRVRP